MTGTPCEVPVPKNVSLIWIIVLNSQSLLLACGNYALFRFVTRIFVQILAIGGSYGQLVATIILDR